MPIDTAPEFLHPAAAGPGSNPAVGVAESAQTPPDADTADVPAPSAPALSG